MLKVEMVPVKKENFDIIIERLEKVKNEGKYDNTMVFMTRACYRAFTKVAVALDYSYEHDSEMGSTLITEYAFEKNKLWIMPIAGLSKTPLQLILTLQTPEEKKKFSRVQDAEKLIIFDLP